MNINKNTVVADIVADNYNTASVFKKHSIDFCCNGQRTLQEVTAKNNINLNELIDQILTVEPTDSRAQSFHDWDLDFLSDYIYQNHHLYVEKRGPEIMAYLDKLCKVHGTNHPELYEVTKLFKEAIGDLSMHMKKEELILFPFIKKIAKANKTNTTLNQPPFGSISNPINMMHTEHDNEGERFRKIAELTHNYTPPSDACSTYKITYKFLQEFEDDLHKHIHIENNILFKKAITLENKLHN